MPKLLSGFIAKQLAKRLGKHVLPAVLIKVVNTTRTPGAVSAGLNPTETSHKARGWIESYEAKFIDGTTIRAEDRKVSLLGASIAGKKIPVQGDRVTIEGTTYRVIAVSRDPDAAAYELQSRA